MEHITTVALFLMMVKGSYFCVFTMLGGQTVGKMATGIWVVTDNDQEVEPARAVQRTLAALASVATVGIGFAPVLFAGDRRALHDRVAVAAADVGIDHVAGCIEVHTSQLSGSRIIA